MSDFKPEVGKKALYGEAECNVLSEHNGYFWCEFNNGTISTMFAHELTRAKTDEDKLIDEMCEVFCFENIYQKRHICKELIKAGYRKTKTFQPSLKIVDGDITIGGYNLIIKAGTVEASVDLYDAVYKKLKE